MLPFKRLFTRPTTTPKLNHGDIERLCTQLHISREWRFHNQQQILELVRHTEHPDQIDRIRAAQLRMLKRRHQQNIDRLQQSIDGGILC